jgi:hypothetical protein
VEETESGGAETATEVLPEIKYNTQDDWSQEKYSDAKSCLDSLKTVPNKNITAHLWSAMS